MRATEVLKREHDLIERGLDLLDTAVERIRSERPLLEGFGPWAVGFFRSFADGTHHAKEEDVFFPLLEQRGVPREGGPIGVMCTEHELGRDLVRRMEKADAAGAEGRPDFAAAAAQLATLLRQHIFKENNILFKMADGCLSEADDAHTMAEFDRQEHEADVAAARERYEEEMAAWEAAFKQ